MKNIKNAIISHSSGILLALFLALISMALSQLPFFARAHISPLIIGIFLSIGIAVALSVAQGGNENATFITAFHAKTKAGINFSAKKILRLGIIFYGVFVSLGDIQSVGVVGVALCVGVVATMLALGFVIGTRIFGLDRELAILVSAGCAICGAAAVLALESALRSSTLKGAIAVGTVVVFGLLGMFAYPLLYGLGLMPFTPLQEGVYMGATLYEVANVVGAGNAISTEGANIALITKMIRVALLAPVLLVVPFLFDWADARRTESSSEKSGSAESKGVDSKCVDSGRALDSAALKTRKKLYIPYFAIWFVVVICLHSYIDFPPALIDCVKFLSVLCLSMAMCALGLQVDYKQFLRSGGGAFWLAAVLFVIVSVGGFLAVYALSALGFFS